MSKNSKARRDARKKKQPRPRSRTVTTNNQSAEPHAALLGDGGAVLGGAAFHSGEWILLLNGKVVSGTNSAAMILAMLKHTASVRESEGMTVRLTYSTTLKAAAIKEAEAEGKTLDAYLEMLEAERVERLENKQPTVDEESENPIGLP
jgi:hypothetical protein